MIYNHIFPFSHSNAYHNPDDNNLKKKHFFNNRTVFLTRIRQRLKLKAESGKQFGWSM